MNGESPKGNVIRLACVLPLVAMVFACEGESHQAERTAAQTTASGDNAALRYWRVMIYTYPFEVNEEETLDRLLSGDAELTDDLKERWTIWDEALTDLRTAVKVNHCDFAIDRELGPALWMPHLVSMRILVKQLCLDARFRREEGEGQEAAERLAIAMGICRDLGRDCTFISSWMAGELFLAVCDEVDALRTSRETSELEWEIIKTVLQTIETRNPLQLANVPKHERELNSKWLIEQCEAGDCLALLEQMMGDVPRDRPGTHQPLTERQAHRQLIEFDKYLVEMQKAFNLEDEDDSKKRVAALDIDLKNWEYGSIAPVLSVSLARTHSLLLEIRYRIRELSIALDET